jgi:hypothetical protein
LLEALDETLEVFLHRCSEQVEAGEVGGPLGTGAPAIGDDEALEEPAKLEVGEAAYLRGC